MSDNTHTNEMELSAALQHVILTIMRGCQNIEGIVTSVDMQSFTCSVKIGDATFTKVPLRVLINNQASIIEVPKLNTNVLMTFRDGNINRPQILMIHQLDKLLINCETVVEFNKGNLGGMVKAKELQTQSNKDKAILDALLTIINGPPITEPGNGAPSALQAALRGVLSGKQSGVWTALENTKITQ